METVVAKTETTANAKTNLCLRKFMLSPNLV